MVAGDDRHPFESIEQVGQGGRARAELLRQGGRRQVARDQDVVRLQPLDPAHDLVQPLQPELAGPPRQELDHPDGALVEQPQRVERVAPDVDVGQVDDPQRRRLRPGRPLAPVIAIEVPAEPADQDIVGRMRADRDAESTDHEDPGEVDPGQPSEDEREPGEGLAGDSRVMRQREEQGRAPSPPVRSPGPRGSARVAGPRR